MKRYSDRYSPEYSIGRSAALHQPVRRAVHRAAFKAFFVALLFTFVTSCLLASPGSTFAKGRDNTKKAHALSDRAQFGYAGFLFSEGDYLRAAREYQRVIEKFPGSPLVEESHFNLAGSLLKGERFKEARDQFELFLGNFGDGPLSRDASIELLKAKRHLRIKLERDRRQLKDRQLKKKTTPPILRSSRTRPLRAVQVMLFNGQGPGSIDRELRRLKASGVDTVIVRVFHNRGDRYYRLKGIKGGPGVYFKTTGAPVLSDVLSIVVRLAKRHKLKVFAWMTTRYANYGLEDRDDLACKGYDLKQRRLVKCKGLDLFSDSVLRHLEGLFRDLASYDIDGILFQDDLVLRHNEGFGPNAERLYKWRSSRGPLDPESFYIRTEGSTYVGYTTRFWEWSAWKNKRLIFVTERLKRVARARNPKVKFAINLMYESVTNPPFALAWLSQDLKRAAASGFDYYSIMAYHRQMADELEKDPYEIRLLIKQMAREALKTVVGGGGRPEQVLIKFQTVDWNSGEPLSNGELVGLIRSVKTSGVSLALVPYRKGLPLKELSSLSGVAGVAMGRAGADSSGR